MKTKRKVEGEGNLWPRKSTEMLLVALAAAIESSGGGTRWRGAGSRGISRGERRGTTRGFIANSMQLRWGRGRALTLASLLALKAIKAGAITQGVKERLEGMAVLRLGGEEEHGRLTGGLRCAVRGEGREGVGRLLHSVVKWAIATGPVGAGLGLRMREEKREARGAERAGELGPKVGRRLHGHGREEAGLGCIRCQARNVREGFR